MNYEKICSQAISIVNEAAEFIQREAGKITGDKVKSKGIHNYVTYVDTTSEKMLVKGLEALAPGCGFIAEEGTGNEKDEFNWIIDPLDGTTNYIHSLPCYSISVALAEKGKIVLGIVHEINLNECFYAWKGGAAMLNGKVIRVSNATKIEDSLLATGFPYYDYHLLDQYMALFRYFMQHSHGVRRIGSAAVDLAYVACGRFEGFYEYSLNPWDVAAGAFIIEQAGGRVGDFSGGDNYLNGKQIIASCNGIYNELLEVVGNFMVK